MSLSSIGNFWPQDVPVPALQNDALWGKYAPNGASPHIHIAILSSTYLELILDKHKTIESRFSMNRRIPYQSVTQGDILLLKQTGGPIKGIARVSKVWYYNLNDTAIDYIKDRFGDGMQIQDETYWEACERKTYATLIRLSYVRRIDPIKFIKRDRNAWVTFQPTPSPLSPKPMPSL